MCRECEKWICFLDLAIYYQLHVTDLLLNYSVGAANYQANMKTLHALHTRRDSLGDSPGLAQRELPYQFRYVCEAPTLCRPHEDMNARPGFYDLNVS